MWTFELFLAGVNRIVSQNPSPLTSGIVPSTASGEISNHTPGSAPTRQTTPPASPVIDTLAPRHSPRKKAYNGSSQKHAPTTSTHAKRRRSDTAALNIRRSVPKPVTPVPSIDLEDATPKVIGQHFLVRVTPVSNKLPERAMDVSSINLWWLTLNAVVQATLPRLTTPRRCEVCAI